MGDVETDENEKTVLRIDCQLREFFILVLCPPPAPTIHLLLSTPITNSLTFVYSNKFHWEYGY
jgi:hypothetical protein